MASDEASHSSTCCCLRRVCSQLSLCPVARRIVSAAFIWLLSLNTRLLCGVAAATGYGSGRSGIGAPAKQPITLCCRKGEQDPVLEGRVGVDMKQDSSYHKHGDATTPHEATAAPGSGHATRAWSRALWCARSDRNIALRMRC